MTSALAAVHFPDLIAPLEAHHGELRTLHNLWERHTNCYRALTKKSAEQEITILRLQSDIQTAKDELKDALHDAAVTKAANVQLLDAVQSSYNYDEENASMHTKLIKQEESENVLRERIVSLEERIMMQAKSHNEELQRQREAFKVMRAREEVLLHKTIEEKNEELHQLRKRINDTEAENYSAMVKMRLDCENRILSQRTAAATAAAEATLGNNSGQGSNVLMNNSDIDIEASNRQKEVFRSKLRFLKQQADEALVKVTAERNAALQEVTEKDKMIADMRTQLVGSVCDGISGDYTIGTSATQQQRKTTTCSNLKKKRKMRKQ